MRENVNPVVAAVVLVIVVVVVGFFVWRGTEGKTFSKDGARGGENKGLPTLQQPK